MWAILNKTTNKVQEKFYSKAAAEAMLSKMSSHYKVEKCPSDIEIFKKGTIVMEDTFKDTFLRDENGTTIRINVIEYDGKLFYFRIEDGYIAKVMEVGVNGVY